MAMSSTTANWHWKNKQLNSWGAAWFERELPRIEVTEGDSKVGVVTVTEVDGDVEVGRRKSKLITIFDVKIKLDWSGTASDGTAVEGKLEIPEVSHEITVDRLSDYVFEWELSTSSSPAVDALFQLAKTQLRTALEAKFAEFPVDMLDTHGKDLIVAGGSESGTATPVNGASGTPPAASSGASTPALAPKPAKSPAPVMNTSTVSREARFMASAEDLFELLTDARRIPTWSRAAATFKPEPGADYSLFGGGVTGQVVSVERPKNIVSTWRLQSPTWPSGHYATLTTSFDQGSDSTEVKFKLTGVPKGMENEIESNLEGYYVRGLKTIGYVRPSVSAAPRRPAPPIPVQTRKWLLFGAVFIVLLALALLPVLRNR